MLFHGTMNRNGEGIIEVGNVSLETLAETYGTPLYVYDQSHIEQQCRLFSNSFRHQDINGIVAYASKAFLTIAMAQLIANEGLSIDVASKGELYTVYKADFPMERVYFHGNNKTIDELELALELGCGNIILDNQAEYQRLSRLCHKNKQNIDVYIRVNPGIDVSTHDYIKTSKLDSKFGLNLEDQSTHDFIEEVAKDEYIKLMGLHAHIGSQIFQTEPFLENVSRLLEYYADFKKEGIEFTGVNIGGGFGVYYTDEDQPINMKKFLKELIAHVANEAKRNNLNLNEVIIEPGRSIVCNAGSTLYTVGSTKKTVTGKEYVFVDGGMSDNPRVALYQAKYESALVKETKADKTPYVIAGKLCESGDVLSNHALLPQPQAGDLLLMSSTGAYTFSMSSNYNRVLRPAVVFVKRGSHQCVVQRQTLDDLVQGDLSL